MNLGKFYAMSQATSGMEVWEIDIECSSRCTEASHLQIPNGRLENSQEPLRNASLCNEEVMVPKIALRSYHGLSFSHDYLYYFHGQMTHFLFCLPNIIRFPVTWRNESQILDDSRKYTSWFLQRVRVTLNFAFNGVLLSNCIIYPFYYSMNPWNVYFID